MVSRRANAIEMCLLCVIGLYYCKLWCQYHSKHHLASTQPIVVGVGVESAVYGIVVAALVEQIVGIEAQAYFLLRQFVFCTGIDAREISRRRRLRKKDKII